MPINIMRQDDDADSIWEGNEGVALLCDCDWGLPEQIDALEKWLLSDGKRLPKGKYVADIGFGQRPDAGGGGGVISLSAMQIMVSIGMEVFLSEYPGWPPDPKYPGWPRKVDWG
jgi:hypothetical protein